MCLVRIDTGCLPPNLIDYHLKFYKTKTRDKSTCLGLCVLILLIQLFIE